MLEATHVVFIDAGVLIAAARGIDMLSQRALDILGAPALQFASSDLIRLEVLPKAIYRGNKIEAEFYQAFLVPCACGRRSQRKSLQRH